MPISKSLLRRSKSSDHSQTKSIGRINEDESNDVDPDKFTEALADTQKTMTKLAHRRVMSDPLGNGADPKSAMLCESDILPTFPPFVAGSVKAKNCWSQPPLEIFSVRGGNYLQDSKKVGSGPCLLKTRGCDLLLSCHAPSNIGSDPRILGGTLRRVPTFVINFRFPWGVLVKYFEIPSKYCPYLDRESPPLSMDGFSPSEKTLCRFFMADEKQKNNTLKLIPYVAEGPWIVRSIVTGTPTIIGNKLPVTYHYQPADGDQAQYLEADLDIGNSSATAKNIVGLCRQYMNSLTVDLGFLIQGNTVDELPEQMLCSIRVHGPDPSTCSRLN